MKIPKNSIPRDTALFPYNVGPILKELPKHICISVGEDYFTDIIESFYEGKCQHPPAKTTSKCRRCVKDKIFAETFRARNQPIYNQQTFTKDIMYFNYKNKGDKTWSSLAKYWDEVRREKLVKINHELRAMIPHFHKRSVFSAAHL